MKKILFVGIMLITAMFLLSGCYANLYNSRSKYYICDDGTEVLEKSQCDAIAQLKEQAENMKEYVPVIEDEVEEEEAEETEEASEELTSSEEAIALLSKFSKVKNIQFSYVYSKDLPKNTYYVSKDKMKIKLEARFGVVSEEYDTVYLNLENKIAFGYCENRDKDMCSDRNKAISVEFDDYFIETPFNWVEAVESVSLTGKSKTYENRNVKEMEFTRNGLKGAMFVDSFFGMPVYITLGDNIFEFRDMSVNELTDEDLIHQKYE